MTGHTNLGYLRPHQNWHRSSFQLIARLGQAATATDHNDVKQTVTDNHNTGINNSLLDPVTHLLLLKLGFRVSIYYEQEGIAAMLHSH